MCGIFGYVGKRNDPAKIVFEGLKSLEYRGYDSWGMAIAISNFKFQISNRKEKYQKLIVEKHVGPVGEIKSDSSLIRPERSRRVTYHSSLALGHTRWATHGGVTKVNAHPHLDCSGQIAVVHNGIVENFQQLKEELLKKGHKFISDTDTEVIPHLIEDCIKHPLGETPLKGVSEAFKRLTGLNAIVVMAHGQLIAAKSGSPLVIGVGEDEYFVASDAAGLLKHTNKVIFLKDYQIAVLGRDLKLVNMVSGKTVKPAIEVLDWKFEDTQRGKFDHFFLKEVYDQPKVLENIAINYQRQANEMAQLIRDSHGVFLVACGSASYAALAGTYLFSKISKKHVNFSIGSEFDYLEDYIGARTLVIPISQSGESVDVIQPVVRAKQKGAKVAAIVNVLGSTLYRESDYKLLLGAGVEKAVVATKSLTAMVAVLILIAYSLAGRQKQAKDLLLKAAKDVRWILEKKNVSKIKRVAGMLKNNEHVYIIGRGLSYATALEATLKLKETTYIHAEGFAGGELKHGVIALIEKGTSCIVFAPNDQTYDEIISNAAEIKARGGYIIGVGPKNNEIFDDFLETGDLAEATMISQIIVSQLLAYFIAVEKGINPDMPRNLAKSVTVK